MRYIFFSLFLHFFFVGNTQSNQRHNNINSFFLEGNVLGRDTGYIILRYYNELENWVSDTTYLKDGKFKFIGAINQPTLAQIKGYPFQIDFDEANLVNIFLEPGNQYVTLVENAYQKAKIKGLKTQKEYASLLRQFDSVNLLSKSLSDELLEAKKDLIKHPDDSLKNLRFDSLNDKLKPTVKILEALGILFISDHPDSYVSPYFLGIYFNRLHIDSVELLYNRFTKNVKDSRNGQYIAEQIHKKKQVSIGAIAPDFKLSDSNGKEISLTQLRGRVILLDFWASWCVPCIANIPHLQELYEKYQSEGFRIITISIDRRKQDWEKAVEKEKINNWYNVLANEEIRSKYPNVYQPIPSQILIGESGKIVWSSNNENNIKRLENVLREYMIK